MGDDRRDDYGRVVNRDFRGEGGDAEQGRDVLRAAQRQDEGGVPGVRRRHVAGRRCMPTKGEDFGDRGDAEGRQPPRGAGEADARRRASSTRRS